jgi:hypothetical protein
VLDPSGGLRGDLLCALLRRAADGALRGRLAPGREVEVVGDVLPGARVRRLEAVIDAQRQLGDVAQGARVAARRLGVLTDRR